MYIGELISLLEYLYQDKIFDIDALLKAPADKQINQNIAITVFEHPQIDPISNIGKNSHCVYSYFSEKFGRNNAIFFDNKMPKNNVLSYVIFAKDSNDFAQIVLSKKIIIVIEDMRSLKNFCI